MQGKNIENGLINGVISQVWAKMFVLPSGKAIQNKYFYKRKM
jgi:hypothetical protein